MFRAAVTSLDLNIKILNVFNNKEEIPVDFQMPDRDLDSRPVLLYHSYRCAQQTE